MGLNFSAAVVHLEDSSYQIENVLEQIGLGDIELISAEESIDNLDSQKIFAMPKGNQLLVLGSALFNIYDQIRPPTIYKNKLNIDFFYQAEFENTFLHLKIINGRKRYSNLYSDQNKRCEFVSYMTEEEMKCLDYSQEYDAMHQVAVQYQTRIEDIEGNYLGPHCKGRYGLGYKEGTGFVYCRELSKAKDPKREKLQELKLVQGCKFSRLVAPSGKSKLVGKPFLRASETKECDGFVKQVDVYYEVFHALFELTFGCRLDRDWEYERRFSVFNAYYIR